MNNQKKAKENLRKNIVPFEKSNTKASVLQLINTMVPFVVLWFLAYLSLSVSYWLTLAIAIPTAGLLVRIFIIFHDCCHQSFFSNRKANTIVGTITGILTFTPFHQWRYTHNVHHATNGKLDNRGVGDVWTMTVEEYVAASRLKKLMYRLYRNPVCMFGIGPFYIFLIDYRFNRSGARMKERLNTYLTNGGIAALIVGLSFLIGWQQFLLVHGPIFFFSAAAGIWLFYVQHQFEDSYFERNDKWDYIRAAVHGSSYYELPHVLRWMTGNIGYHHVHHLSPKLPNYHLQKVHTAIPDLQKVTTINLLTSLRSLHHRLWDEENRTFVSFGELKRRERARKKAS
ncbi:fatty acid desaturase [Alkalihalobacillus oceani]|uniref:fatty acid desaturase n=1 Tax=Halalkalibacter oceani TaxID=1653776 RepID=UPI00203FF855|nr:fatty acid desaturase [Halalkalibacter oceani]MCM3759925.1 fatty acid desaturase [Halalkalibacter oceani]